jgi:hypothetical protein
VCHYEVHADFNASVNVHHSFYREWHWQQRTKPPPVTAECRDEGRRIRSPRRTSSGGRSLWRGTPLKQARPVPFAEHVKVVRLATGPKRARSNPNALADST